VCGGEFSDGRDGKKRRGEHLKREGYGVPRDWGNRPSGPQLARV